MYSLEHAPKNIYNIWNKTEQKHLEKCEGAAKIIEFRMKRTRE